MKEVLTTLLNSPVMASIVEAGLVCICISWLQNRYNKKLEEEKALIKQDCDIRLERYRVEFNQMLSEHQTRFDCWHHEKAKAIKDLYTNACDLYYALFFLQAFEKVYGNRIAEESVKERKRRRNEISSLRLKVRKDWYYLRLFLDDEEDNAFVEYEKEIDSWSVILFDNNEQNRAKEIKENGDAFINNMKQVLGKLRSVFREALYSVTTDVPPNGRDISFHRSNQMMQSEQNSSAE